MAGVRRYYAFGLRDFSREIYEGVPARADESEKYDCIPVICAKTDEIRAREISTLPGVLTARRIPESYRRVVFTIDQLLSLIELNRTQFHTNGIAKAVPGLEIEDVPPYPVLDPSSPGGIRFDTTIRLETRRAWFGALSMSLEADSLIRFSPEDPINIATYAASHRVPVVMAAGNRTTWSSGEIRGWAEAKWVVSVGATEDEEGTRLAPYSLAGSSTRPGSGPTVVAYGSDDAPTGKVGTSFAAPRVSEEIAVLTAFCLTLQHFVQKATGVEPEGIPVVGIAYADLNILPGRGEGRNREHGWFVTDLQPPAQPLPALPAAGFNLDVLDAVLGTLRSLSLDLEVGPSPGLIRQMLEASAQPVPGYQPHQVGRGFVSPSNTLRYLEGFSGADFATLFAKGQMSVEALDRLATQRLVDTSSLAVLVNAWRQSTILYGVDLNDFRRGPRDPIQILA